jgi:hypothetical protein
LTTDDAYGLMVFVRAREEGAWARVRAPPGAGPATERPRPTTAASLVAGGANSRYVYLAATGQMKRRVLRPAMRARRP